MSSASLSSFLTKLDKELESYAEYRAFLNTRPQTFVFNKRTLHAQTIKQIELKRKQAGIKGDIPKEIKEDLRNITDTYGDKLISNMESLTGETLTKKQGGRVEVVFNENTDIPTPEWLKQKNYAPLSAYSKIRAVYKEVLNEMFKEMQEYLSTTEIGSIKNKDGSEKRSILGFFDSGHEDKAGVFERFLFEKTTAIAKEVSRDIDESSDLLLKQAQSLLSTNDFAFVINKIDDLETIEIKIESTTLNRSRGAKVGEFSKNLRARIKHFTEKSDLANLEGSDSFVTQKRKKALKTIEKSFEKIKGVEVSLEDTVIKKSKGPVSLSKKSTSKGKNVKVKAQGRSSRVPRSKSIPSQPLAIIQQINAKLPETIAKNMRYPRLEYQTGRFAESAQILDVNQTRQGYMSFGYTYQKYPYQTFEPGYAQGSVDRDPRRLIDRSIREIAAELAIGRFYTRRI